MADRADYSSNTADRAPCSVCGRSLLLTKKGVIRYHGAKDGSWPPARCPGAGRPPKEG